jgi:hypothetical protein
MLEKERAHPLFWHIQDEDRKEAEHRRGTLLQTAHLEKRRDVLGRRSKPAEGGNPVCEAVRLTRFPRREEEW